MIRININRADGTVTEKETLTAGRVGLDCEFTFSSEWNGLNKIAVCEGAEVKAVVMDSGSNAIVIPAECFSSAGYRLRVGVFGINAAGSIAIPTVWVKVG